MWRQPLWLIAAGHLMGLAAILYAIAHTPSQPGMWWLSAGMYLVFSLAVSVGLHRYFAHGAFQCSRFWHWLFAGLSVMLLQGSALGWAAAHATHHAHSDTPRDVHYSRWDYLVWKRYRSVPMVGWRLRKLSADPALRLTHRYGLLLWLAAVALLACWPAVLLWAYLVPLGLVHLVGGLHQVISHSGGAPRNLSWLEYLLPACGEWNHANHHARQRHPDTRTKWWHLDVGYLFIFAIEKKATP